MEHHRSPLIAESFEALRGIRRATSPVRPDFSGASGQGQLPLSLVSETPGLHLAGRPKVLWTCIASTWRQYHASIPAENEAQPSHRITREAACRCLPDARFQDHVSLQVVPDRSIELRSQPYATGLTYQRSNAGTSPREFIRNSLKRCRPSADPSIISLKTWMRKIQMSTRTSQPFADLARLPSPQAAP